MDQNVGQVRPSADGVKTIYVRDYPVCVAIRYFVADRAGRDRIARQVRPLRIVDESGIGALVLVHEAEHVAMPAADECQVEKAALARVQVVLQRFEPRAWPRALKAAVAYDAQLAPEYHGC